MLTLLTNIIPIPLNIMFCMWVYILLWRIIYCMIGLIVPEKWLFWRVFACGWQKMQLRTTLILIKYFCISLFNHKKIKPSQHAEY